MIDTIIASALIGIVAILMTTAIKSASDFTNNIQYQIDVDDQVILARMALQSKFGCEANLSGREFDPSGSIELKNLTSGGDKILDVEELNPENKIQVKYLRLDLQNNVDTNLYLARLSMDFTNLRHGIFAESNTLAQIPVGLQISGNKIVGCFRSKSDVKKILNPVNRHGDPKKGENEYGI